MFLFYTYYGLLTSVNFYDIISYMAMLSYSLHSSHTLECAIIGTGTLSKQIERILHDREAAQSKIFKDEYNYKTRTHNPIHYICNHVYADKDSPDVDGYTVKPLQEIPHHEYPLNTAFIDPTQIKQLSIEKLKANLKKQGIIAVVAPDDYDPKKTDPLKLEDIANKMVDDGVSFYYAPLRVGINPNAIPKFKPKTKLEESFESSNL